MSDDDEYSDETGSSSDWPEDEEIDVIDHPTAPAGVVDCAAPPSAVVDTSAAALTDRVQGEKPAAKSRLPKPANSSTPAAVLKRSHSGLSLNSATSVAPSTAQPPRPKPKKRRQGRGRDTTPPGPPGKK
jgi:hypothetical protein